MRRVALVLVVGVTLVASACATQPTGGGGGNPDPQPKAVIAVSTSISQSCAVIADGTVECWGAYSRPTNGFSDANTPEPVPAMTGAVSVAASPYLSCAVRTNGTVACWGINSMLGLPPQPGTTEAAVTIPGLAGVVEVVVDTYVACARTAAGAVWCWGSNNYGQLGDGSMTPFSTLPVQVVGLSDAVALSTAAGRTWRCAPRVRSPAGATTTLRALLGGGTFDEYSNVPVTVVGMTGAIDVAANGSTCALRSNGTAACWGVFDFPGLHEVPGLAGGVALGSDGSDCVLHADGTATCNLRRAIEIGEPLTAWPGLSDGVAIAAGSAVGGCALHTDASLSCFGFNQYGGLADGSPDYVTVPTGVSGAQDISLGGSHSCRLLQFSGLSCVGRNQNGQLGFGTAGFLGGFQAWPTWSPASVTALPYELPTRWRSTAATTTRARASPRARSTAGD